MLKEKLRLNFTSRRRKFTNEEISSYSLAIGQLVQQLPIWDHKYYHIFLSIERNKEIDTTSIICILKDSQKQIIVPKVKNEVDLESILLINETELTENRWGIPEPIDGKLIDPALIDVVFVPLLVFDDNGHRVGYGKGYYDRFLQSCQEDVVKVGLCYFDPVDEISDLQPGDVAMDYCVTPKKIYSF